MRQGLTRSIRCATVLVNLPKKTMVKIPKKSSAKKRLTGREILLCQSIMLGRSTAAAAREAGYPPTHRVAHGQLSPRILAELERLRKLATMVTLIDRDEIIRELRKVAFGDIRRTRTKDDAVMRIVDMGEDVTAGIEEVTEIETSIGSSRKIKLHSKLAALRELTKLGGLYPETGTGEGVRLSFTFEAPAQDDQAGEQQGAAPEAGVSITLPAPEGK